MKKINAIQATDARYLAKKTDYNTKINELEKNYLL